MESTKRVKEVSQREDRFCMVLCVIQRRRMRPAKKRPEQQEHAATRGKLEAASLNTGKPQSIRSRPEEEGCEEGAGVGRNYFKIDGK